MKPPGRTKKTWTINGITKPMQDWCAEYGVSYNMVAYRINHKGMTVLEALTTEKMADGRPRKKA